jgi:hypothetical protein
MAVRKVSNWGGNIIGMFPSFKMADRHVYYESTIERDLCFFLEFDPCVASYTEQPFCIQHIASDGTTHSYTPDFQVVYTNGTRSLVECKPAARLDDPHTQQQIIIGQTWASANKYTFVLVTDADLRQGHTLANITLLWRYRQFTVAPDLITRTGDYLTHHPGATIIETAIYATQNPQHPPHSPFLCHLLFHHLLSADLTHPLSAQSRLWLPQQMHQEA